MNIQIQHKNWSLAILKVRGKTQPAFTCSESTMEKADQSVKFFKANTKDTRTTQIPARKL